MIVIVPMKVVGESLFTPSKAQKRAVVKNNKEQFKTNSNDEKTVLPMPSR